MRKLSGLIIAVLFSSHVVNAVPVYTALGNVTNNSTPSVWLNYTFDITSLISGSSNAELSFDLRNDWDRSFPTTSEVLFGVEASSYFVHFNYASGSDTSHWRNVTLNIDSLLYIDQFGAFNNHLGGELAGTAQQGAGIATNILGESGFDASTYVMSLVPVPAAVWLFGSGLLGLVGVARRKKQSGTDHE